MEVSEYIDWARLWNDTTSHYKDESFPMEWYMSDAEREIHLLYLSNSVPPLINSECTLDGERRLLIFVLGEEKIGANESDAQGSGYSFTFFYNLDDEGFTDYEYEQG